MGFRSLVRRRGTSCFCTLSLLGGAGERNQSGLTCSGWPRIGFFKQGDCCSSEDRVLGRLKRRRIESMKESNGITAEVVVRRRGTENDKGIELKVSLTANTRPRSNCWAPNLDGLCHTSSQLSMESVYLYLVHCSLR